MIDSVSSLLFFLDILHFAIFLHGLCGQPRHICRSCLDTQVISSISSSQSEISRCGCPTNNRFESELALQKPGTKSRLVTSLERQDARTTRSRKLCLDILAPCAKRHAEGMVRSTSRAPSMRFDFMQIAPRSSTKTDEKLECAQGFSSPHQTCGQRRNCSLHGTDWLATTRSIIHPTWSRFRHTASLS